MAHNEVMTALQPGWPTPVVEADPRLAQYYRFALSNEYTAAGTQTVSYGDSRGGGVIGWNRIEVDFIPPSYIHHSSTASDGFGDASALVKYRIASANAQHGNFIVTAIVGHSFATGSYQNGAETDSWNPNLAGGIGLSKRFSVESQLGGALPTGKIAAQGRAMVWNALAHEHLTEDVWLELENNATFFFAGPHDGRMQNFITPAVFYTFRPKDWSPTHAFYVFTGGMQIATSGFHTYNHKMIVETRIVF